MVNGGDEVRRNSVVSRRLCPRGLRLVFPSIAAQGTNCALYIQLLFFPLPSHGAGLLTHSSPRSWITTNLFQCSYNYTQRSAAAVMRKRWRLFFFFLSACRHLTVNFKAFFFFLIMLGFKGGLLKLALFISWLKRYCVLCPEWRMDLLMFPFWGRWRLWNAWRKIVIRPLPNVLLVWGMIGKWMAGVIVTSPNLPSNQDFISFHADFVDSSYPPSHVLQK